MCEPTTVALVVAGVAMAAAAASTAMQYQSAQEAAQDQKDYQSSQIQAQQAEYDYNKEQTLKSYWQEEAAQDLKIQQEQNEISQQAQINAWNARSAVASAKAAAGEAGIAGSNADLLVADFYRQEAYNNNLLEINMKNVRQQGEYEKKSIWSSAMSQIESKGGYVVPQKISSPNPWAYGVQGISNMAQAGASGYSMGKSGYGAYKSLTAPTPGGNA